MDDCFLETHPLGLRSHGRTAVRIPYEGYFTAFPDLAPADEGLAFGDNGMVVWGPSRARAAGNGWAYSPSGDPFALPFSNVTEFRDGLMAGETIYFDLATLCEQAALPLDDVRAGARDRANAQSRPVPE